MHPNGFLSLVVCFTNSLSSLNSQRRSRKEAKNNEIYLQVQVYDFHAVVTGNMQPLKTGVH